MRVEHGAGVDADVVPGIHGNRAAIGAGGIEPSVDGDVALVRGEADVVRVHDVAGCDDQPARTHAQVERGVHAGRIETGVERRQVADRVRVQREAAAARAGVLPRARTRCRR